MDALRLRRPDDSAPYNQQGMYLRFSGDYRGAADAFAQTLLGLSFAPRLLDYLTVWIHNQDAGRRGLTALAGP